MTTIPYESYEPRESHRRRSRAAKFMTATKNNTAAVARRIVAPHKASLKNLAQIPLTVIGTGCVDFAAFHLAHGWGWLVTGASCMFIEHLIADDEVDQ